MEILVVMRVDYVHRVIRGMSNKERPRLDVDGGVVEAAFSLVWREFDVS